MQGSTAPAVLLAFPALAPCFWSRESPNGSRSIPRWLRDARLPGVSLAIIDAGKVLWEGPSGVKDAGTGAPVRRDTVFAACSNTKPVFAYAVVTLCEKGVMDLDVPLTKYTSRRFDEGDPRLDLITARHVLTHTTGFPNWREPGKPVPIQFTPGTQRQYSGEGFRYLQSVVQEVTRQPFAEFMRVNVLEPFRMASSRIVWDDKAYATSSGLGWVIGQHGALTFFEPRQLGVWLVLRVVEAQLQPVAPGAAHGLHQMGGRYSTTVAEGIAAFLRRHPIGDARP